MGLSAQHKALLELLADGQWHSATQLQETAGCVPEDLARIAQYFRQLGLQVIYAAYGKRICLRRPLDLLKADEIAAHLPSVGDLKLELVGVIESTNSYLLSVPKQACPIACVAEYQTSGRGRANKNWHMGYAAGLCFSVALVTQVPANQLAGLSLAVGVRLVQYLRGLGIKQAALKWPNDVLIAGHKVAGILTETQVSGGVTKVVIGVGMNVKATSLIAQAIQQPWTALEKWLEQPVNRSALTGQIIYETSRAAHGFFQNGAASYATQWPLVDAFYGKAIALNKQGKQLAGIVKGITETGCLRLEINGCEEIFYAGEISLRVPS